MLKSILIGVDGSRRVPRQSSWHPMGEKVQRLVGGIGIVDDATIYTPDAETLGADCHNWERDEQR